MADMNYTLINGTKFLNFHVEEITCHYLSKIHNTTEQCNFVLHNGTCEYVGIIYPYTELTYCQLAHLRPIALLVLAFVLFMLFVSIGSVADDFLCPSLLTISKTFHLPDHIAGVTFLALGNGAPDIFASIGGIRKSKPELIFSSLFGAGIFVTTVVTGSVLVTGDFALMRRPVTRDIIFYIGGAYLVWFFVYQRFLQLKHSLSFLIYYLFYIFTIILARYIYVRLNPDDDPVTIDDDLNSSINDMPYVTPNGTIYELSSRCNSRKQSNVSIITIRRSRQASIEDGVILPRFHRSGTYGSSRNRSKTLNSLNHAHHHLENTIVHISKAYEEQRKMGLVEDVRYKETIDLEKAINAKRELILIQQQQAQTKGGYTNDIILAEKPKKPKLFSQLSSASLFSFTSMTEAISEGRDFFIHIFPINIEEWHEYGLLRKLFEVIKAFPYFIMTVCIPVVDLESPNENWCRMLVCTNIICGPQIILFLTKVHFQINGNFPLWALFLIVTPIISIIIYFTTEQNKPPIYHRVFGFIGFITSVIFVNAIAEEVISVLTTIGVIFGLSDSILGLTILAWGNSLGDLIADISMARHGYPGMAISACFGGQMMNMLMGVGLPYTILFSNSHKTQAIVKYTPMMSLLFCTLIISLCISLSTFVFRRFKSSKIHGITLLLLYITYIITALLIEFKIIFH